MVTLTSKNLSEFDLHARAVLGLPIPSIECVEGASAVVLAKGPGALQRAREAAEKSKWWFKNPQKSSCHSPSPSPTPGP
jgi:formate-dependent phosphoribosylglycinamide formyltransferase (GAR transformylase)